MSIAIKGTIKKLFDTKQVSDKFSKKEFVLVTDEGKYSQVLLVQATGDRIKLIDGLNEGDTVNVDANLRGREWTSPSGEVKYFTSVEVWKIERLSAATGAVSSGTTPEDAIPF